MLCQDERDFMWNFSAVAYRKHHSFYEPVEVS